MKRFSLMLAVALALLSNACAADAEFDGECAMGLSLGVQNPTDCSVFWLGPNDKVYCFSSQTAKDRFLEAPQENLSRAQAAWDDPANLKRLIRRE
jgi:hypothetical protein